MIPNQMLLVYRHLQLTSAVAATPGSAGEGHREHLNCVLANRHIVLGVHTLLPIAAALASLNSMADGRYCHRWRAGLSKLLLWWMVGLPKLPLQTCAMVFVPAGRC